jgi:hypothetical protein
MELLERYLKAVGEHLPARGREDTLRELRANLEAEIEGREEELRRSLNSAEIAGVLEAHGVPVLVAARYGQQQFLIGPGLFPFYWYTLKKSFPLVVTAYAVVQGITVILTTGSADQLGPRIGSAAAHFPAVALTFWAVMTLGFAVFEYVQGRYIPRLTLPHWSVSDLPPLEDAPRRSFTHDVADLIVSVLIIVWLLAVPDRPYLIIGPGLRILHGMPFGLTPEWRIFYWQIVTLLIAMIPLKAIMVVPSFRRWRQHLDLVVHALGILVLLVMVQVRTYFVAGAAISMESLKSLNGINSGISLGFKIALAIALVNLFWNAWKLFSASHRHNADFAAAK